MSCFISSQPPVAFHQIYAWSNLLAAWRKAAKGKRGNQCVAQFESTMADSLLDLQSELITERYQPGPYTHFYIHEPKRRKISAAPFRDRVVHHALCNIIEPVFEAKFIPDSYANRTGKGTHKAVYRLQYFAKRFTYVLRLDIIKHFPAIDHQILLNTLSQNLKNEKILNLIEIIIASGNGILDQEFQYAFFPGDDLLDLCRPRGLPIGNLTSQFWSNCYLHPLDLFIKRELGCKAYLRYVDDFALFSDNKKQLWHWKQLIIDRLSQLRLRIHPHSAQVEQVRSGIPWLGFVVYPEYRLIKRRKVVNSSRQLQQRYEQWQQGKITFAEFDAGVQGWINHVRYADSWGLRKHVLKNFRR